MIEELERERIARTKIYEALAELNMSPHKSIMFLHAVCAFLAMFNKIDIEECVSMLQSILNNYTSHKEELKKTQDLINYILEESKQ